MKKSHINTIIQLHDRENLEEDSKINELNAEIISCNDNLMCACKIDELIEEFFLGFNIGIIFTGQSLSCDKCNGKESKDLLIKRIIEKVLNSLLQLSAQYEISMAFLTLKQNSNLTLIDVTTNEQIEKNQIIKKQLELTDLLIQVEYVRELEKELFNKNLSDCLTFIRLGVKYEKEIVYGTFCLGDLGNFEENNDCLYLPEVHEAIAKIANDNSSPDELRPISPYYVTDTIYLMREYLKGNSKTTTISFIPSIEKVNKAIPIIKNFSLIENIAFVNRLKEEIDSDNDNNYNILENYQREKLQLWNQIALVMQTSREIAEKQIEIEIFLSEIESMRLKGHISILNAGSLIQKISLQQQRNLIKQKNVKMNLLKAEIDQLKENISIKEHENYNTVSKVYNKLLDLESQLNSSVEKISIAEKMKYDAEDKVKIANLEIDSLKKQIKNLENLLAESNRSKIEINEKLQLAIKSSSDFENRVVLAEREIQLLKEKLEFHKNQAVKSEDSGPLNNYIKEILSKLDEVVFKSENKDLIKQKSNDSNIEITSKNLPKLKTDQEKDVSIKNNDNLNLLNPVFKTVEKPGPKIPKFGQLLAKDLINESNIEENTSLLNNFSFNSSKFSNEPLLPTKKKEVEDTQLLSFLSSLREGLFKEKPTADRKPTKS